MTHKLCWLKKMIYVLSLLMGLLIVPSAATALINNQTILINITKSEVAKSIAVSPSIITIPVGFTNTFKLADVNGNFKWSAMRGSLSATYGTEVTYTAPDIAENDVVTKQE